MGLAEKSLGADFLLGLSRMIGLNVHEKTSAQVCFSKHLGEAMMGLLTISTSRTLVEFASEALLNQVV